MVLLIAAAIFSSSLNGQPIIATAVSSNFVSSASTNVTGLATNQDCITVLANVTNSVLGVNWSVATPAGSTLRSLATENPVIASVVDSNGVAYVSNGTVSVQMVYTNSSGVFGSVTRVTTTVGGNYNIGIFTNYMAGSAASNSFNSLAALTNGSASIWSGSGRNTNFWLRSATGMTAIPYLERGVLVASNALLVAEHIAPGNGSVMTWLLTNGTAVTASIVARSNISGDLSVCLLSTNVIGIQPMKVCPTNWLSYFPSATNLSGIGFPIVACNQTFGVFSMRCANVMYPWSMRIGSDGSFFPSRTMTVIGGDSGFPIMAYVNGELVVMGTFYTAAGAPCPGWYINEINSAIAAMAGANGKPTNTVSVANWSSFNSY